jgi:hypothetical protein
MKNQILFMLHCSNNISGLYPTVLKSALTETAPGAGEVDITTHLLFSSIKISPHSAIMSSSSFIREGANKSEM